MTDRAPAAQRASWSLASTSLDKCTDFAPLDPDGGGEETLQPLWKTTDSQERVDQDSEGEPTLRTDLRRAAGSRFLISISFMHRIASTSTQVTTLCPRLESHPKRRSARPSQHRRSASNTLIVCPHLGVRSLTESLSSPVSLMRRHRPTNRVFPSLRQIHPVAP